MSGKKLASLFISSLTIWIAGNGLIPLLPVYAQLLGADETISGFYLAFAYLAIAVGALSAGKVAQNRFGRKLPLVIVTLASSPLAWLLGQIGSLSALIFLTALLWFCGGLALALINIIAGAFAGKHERGKIFGTLAMTSALGSVIGGFGTGWLVNTWGYPTMFSVLAVFMLLGPVSVLFIKEKAEKKTRSEDDEDQKSKPLGRHYWLLFAGSITTAIVGFFILLARSVSMNNMGFNPFEISSTIVIGGLVSLPLPYLLGSLSDRVERKHVLIFGYASVIPAIILLAFSNSLWHFWVVSILQGIAFGSITSIGNAFVTDIVSSPSIDQGLAIFGTTTWIGGIIGFALTGVMLQNLGFVLSCLLSAGIGAAGVMLLFWVKSN